MTTASNENEGLVMPGHTAADAAPVAGSDPGHKQRSGILADPSGSRGGLVHRHEYRRGGTRRLTARRRPGLAPFAAVYLITPPAGSSLAISRSPATTLTRSSALHRAVPVRLCRPFVMPSVGVISKPA
jgi:hypothetical protein